MKEGDWLLIPVGLGSLLSVGCGAWLTRRMAPYASSHYKAACLFSVGLAVAIATLAELESIIAIWSTSWQHDVWVSDLDLHCRVTRTTEYIMLTVLALIGLLENVAFLAYANVPLSNIGVQVGQQRPIFGILRYCAFAAWPAGLLAHVTELVPEGGFDASRNLCIQNYAVLGNTFSGALFLAAVSVNIAVLVVWLIWGCCFSRSEVSHAVYVRNARRLIVLILCVLPSFGLLAFCVLFRRHDCPAWIEDAAEIFVASAGWFICLCYHFMGETRLHCQLEQAEVHFKSSCDLEDVCPIEERVLATQDSFSSGGEQKSWESNSSVATDSSGNSNGSFGGKIMELKPSHTTQCGVNSLSSLSSNSSGRLFYPSA